LPGDGVGPFSSFKKGPAQSTETRAEIVFDAVIDVGDLRRIFMKQYDLVIIGAGPAGLTAAIYGCRAGLKVLVLEKNAAGGQMRLTGDIENWPGAELTNGDELSEKMRSHAEHFGAEFLDAQVEALTDSSLEGRIPLRLIKTSNGDMQAKTVIIATGAYHRDPGYCGSKEFHGRGVSYCAICDAGFFRNQTVAVVGGGNTALEQAMYLTNFVSEVYLIHRRDKFRADRLVQERLSRYPKIKLVLNSLVTSIEGGDEVERVKVQNKVTGETTELKVAGVFLFVGHNPHSEFLPPEVSKAEGGWVMTDASLQTTMPGVFAAGDVRDTDLRQIVTAAGDGARAAMNAYRYIEERL
jgi:thioredoxin reductase (NADPH)